MQSCFSGTLFELSKKKIQQKIKYKMQPQHPPGRQVGSRIYYGNFHGREVQCKKCLLVLFTVLCLLIGFILTIVGHTLKPFWPDTSYCDFCVEDNLATLRNAGNCRVAGPIFITFGLLLMLFTIYYFKKKKSEGMTASYGTTTAPTTLTYGQVSQPVNVPYPGTGQMQPSCPQQPYPPTNPQYPAPQPTSQPYPAGTQPYPTAPQPFNPATTQPYPATTQPCPTGSQPYQPSQSGTPYPPTQQPYPGTAQNNPPPPSYSDAVAGSEGLGDRKQ